MNPDPEPDPALPRSERLRRAERTTTMEHATIATLAPTLAAPTRTAPGTAAPGTAAPGRTVTGADRYLTFSLGGELYALSILDVVEIIEHRPLTTVPRMPSDIRGVLNLRGAAVPVLDLSTRFGREATTIARRTGIIIVDARRDTNRPGRRLGILVDAVNKVLHVADGDIQPPPDLGTDLRAEVIKGMARHEDQFIVILDLEQLLPGNV